MISPKWRGAMAIVCLGATSCSVMREVPRDQYATRTERRDVRVDTRAGAKHEFERIQVSADSLTGFERSDTEGSFEEYRPVRLALEDVARMSVRSVDWYRTGLIGGVALAAVLAVAITQVSGGSDAEPGEGPCGPRPCP